MIDEAGELHHVSVVVASIAESLPFYRDTLRMKAGPVREVADQQVRVVFLEAPNTRIELIEPTAAQRAAFQLYHGKGGKKK